MPKLCERKRTYASNMIADRDSLWDMQMLLLAVKPA